MKEGWEVVDDYSVEIWFRIEKDKDGYPQSKNWEQLLARPVLERDDYFRIESIPYFLKNVSRGDIVSTTITTNSELEGVEVFAFDSVVDRGGHNTYRLLLRRKHADDPEFTENELLEKGLAVETEDGNFFAIDVPPTVDQPEIDSFLVAGSSSGRWELQDGYLHTIKTVPSKNS
jgi:hypothetical protein